jgi:beta-galactosidase
MWDGWVDVERPRAHIIGHWNYQPGTIKDVFVVSSADRVELFVNNKSLGFGTRSSGFLYTFKNVAWQAGVVKAVGYDRLRRKICESEIQTAGPAGRNPAHRSYRPGGFASGRRRSGAG